MCLISDDFAKSFEQNLRLILFYCNNEDTCRQMKLKIVRSLDLNKEVCYFVPRMHDSIDTFCECSFQTWAVDCAVRARTKTVNCKCKNKSACSYL